MDYPIMMPPFSFESFDELNKQQAKEYFEWYIEQKGDRLGLLQKILSDSCSGIVLDYSSKTMVDIWKWYEGRISLDEKNEFEFESEKKRYPDWLKGYLSKEKLSLETLKLCTDIAIYFAETIVRNSNGTAYWNYKIKPKSLHCVNKPVISGFKANMDLDHNVILYNLTMKSAEEKEANRLYETYKIWMSYLE